MEPRSKNASGLILAILGLVAVVFPFLPALRDQIIYQQSTNILVKYAVPIMALNFGIGSIVIGLLIFLGILPSYYSKDIKDKTSKAKLDVIVTVFMIPFMITLFFVIFPNANLFYKSFWVLFLLYQSIISVGSMRVLLKTGHTKLS